MKVTSLIGSGGNKPYGYHDKFERMYARAPVLVGVEKPASPMMEITCYFLFDLRLRVFILVEGVRVVSELFLGLVIEKIKLH